MQRHFASEHGCQRLFGQVVECRSKAAGRDDDIRAVACGLNDMAQARRVVAYNRLVKYVDAQLAQTLRDNLRIRVDNVAQQDFRADGNEFCVHGSGSFFLAYGK